MKNIKQKPESAQWLYSMKRDEEMKFDYSKRAAIYNAANRYGLTIRVQRQSDGRGVVKLLSEGCDE